MIATATRLAQTLPVHLADSFGRDPNHEAEQQRMFRELAFGSGVAAVMKGRSLFDQASRYTEIAKTVESIASSLTQDEAQNRADQIQSRSELFSGYRSLRSAEDLAAAAQNSESQGQEFANASSSEELKSRQGRILKGPLATTSDPKGDLYFFGQDLHSAEEDIMGRMLRGERLSPLDMKILDEVRRAKAIAERAEAQLNEPRNNHAFVA